MKMKGIFKTVSHGTDPGKPNVFVYPLAGGIWRAYRFGKGASEAATWDTSANGWTTCAINVTPTLDLVAAAFNGMVVPGTKSRGIAFTDPVDAEKAVAAYGGVLGLPDWFKTLTAPRLITLREAAGGGLSASFPYKREIDDAEGRGLLAMKLGWTPQRGPAWTKYIDVETTQQQTDHQGLADTTVRHVARDGKQEALHAHTNDGWHQQDRAQVKAFLTHKGIRGPLQEDVLGWCAANPWEAVAIPFGPEHPGGRRWNLDGAKLLFRPSENPAPTPHWDMVLNHLGRGLDEAVEASEWCQDRGIKTGADFLRHWSANLIRFPERRLPMLGMFSPEQNTGKSTLNEGLQVLFDERGWCYGDKALNNERGFNKELNGKALCVIEETNLSESRDAYSRLKSWITSHSLQVEGKGADGFLGANFTHWIMTTNDRGWIPIQPGDTRIILWEVTPYEATDIPKAKLMKLLRDEAPCFLHALFQLDLSGVYGRHTLPVLMTIEKAEAMRQVENQRNFPGLDGKALKAAEAIVEMPKPWGPDTATKLCEVLGDWDGEADKKTLSSRANGLGRYMKKIEVHVAHKGIKLHIDPSGKTSRYTITKADES